MLSSSGLNTVLQHTEVVVEKASVRVDVHQETQPAARSPRGSWQTVREVADIRNVSLQAGIGEDGCESEGGGDEECGKRQEQWPDAEYPGRRRVSVWRVAARPVSKTKILLRIFLTHDSVSGSVSTLQLQDKSQNIMSDGPADALRTDASC